MKERLKDRYTILGVFFLVAGFIIVVTLINLQIVQGKKLDSDSQKSIPNIRTIVAPRGGIEDRNGVPIAVNRVGFRLQIIKAGLNSDELNDMLLNLVKILEKNNDSYYKSFKRYLTFGPISFGSALSESNDPITAIIKILELKPKEGIVLKNAKDVFKYIREEKYKINEKYTDAEAYKIMSMRYEIRDYSSMTSVSLAADISKETVAEVEERHHNFNGVSTDMEPLRKYVDASAVSHVLGFIRPIDEKEYEAHKGEGYKMTDLIGKSGIELSAEKYLKGVDGERRVEVNTEGRFTEELNSKAAIPGNKVVLTLDMKLQKIASESLAKTISDIKNKKPGYQAKGNMGDASTGAVVALDVNTGEVLAMASNPTYDPQIFLEGTNNKAAQTALSNLYKEGFNEPATNRAIAGSYPPGSTFKPAVAVAGMMEGLIDRNTTINDPGHKEEEGVNLFCLEYPQSGHGRIPVATALATSCNMFFYQLGMDLGIDRLDKWSKNFGFGEKTGIDIGIESKGIRSNKAYHEKSFTNVWGKIYTAKTSIGQQYNAFTPIQLANYTSTIANGGKKFVPHLIKRVVKYDGSIVEEKKPEFTQLKVSKEAINAVKEGLEKVANSSEGTAESVFRGFPYKVAGKTGTAETFESIQGKCSNNGVFICYAPAEKPTIAIAVVIEKGVFGYYAANVAKDILAEYFNINNKSSVDEIAKPDVVQLTK
jgi:penicillin-binding protein 2